MGPYDGVLKHRSTLLLSNGGHVGSYLNVKEEIIFVQSVLESSAYQSIKNLIFYLKIMLSQGSPSDGLGLRGPTVQDEDRTIHQ